MKLFNDTIKQLEFLPSCRMEKYSLLKLLLPFLLFSCVGLSGQELPPILNYPPDIYQAGSQNWMIAQDEEHFIYAANNQGVLEFNGYDWTNYPSPNETVVRSVQPVGDRIYSGCYMEFGYWTRDNKGRLNYQSLSDSIKNKLIPDEQFWNIIAYDDFIIFQSLQQLFLYHPENGDIKVISPENGIFKLHKVAGTLFFSDHNHRLFQLESGQFTPMLGQQALPSPVVHLWQEGQSYFAQTATTGCYQVGLDKMVKTNRFPFLNGKRIYSGYSLRNGGLAFGTVADGIYLLLDQSGELSYHLDQINGLTNNTMLAIFEDAHNNIWLGTDNGIDCINVNSPFREFTDRSGRLGTVHAAAIHQNDLYLGSNQGLFVKALHSEEPLKLVPGTQGQVWSLAVHQGQLFCGHNDGTLVVNNRRAKSIFNESGTWLVQALPEQDDLLIQGNYYGLSILERKGDKWVFRNKIAGFDYSARFLATPEPDEAYISHEYRGIYGLKLDDDYRNVIAQKLYETPTKGKNASLSAFDNQVYYLSKSGLFILESFDAGFKAAPVAAGTLIAEEYISGKMSVTEGNRLWFFDQNSISFLHNGALNSNLQRQTIPVSNELVNAKSGYENVLSITRDSVLIGTADGYLLLAVDAIPLPRHELYLNAVTYDDVSIDSVQLASLTGPLDLPPQSGVLNFSFSVPSYVKFFRPRFQYRLLDKDSKWSDWTPSEKISFASLDYGTYTLEARSILGRRLSENTISYAFVITRPWYLRFPGIAFFIGLATSLAYLLHWAYTRYYRRQREAIELENQRKIAAQQRESELALSKLRNEQLRQDIEGKSKEMANSMMNLVKKNELLQEIKTILELKRPAKQNIQEVISLIDRSIDESENWSLFKEAFEYADRDFFQKIKERHPDLTPNDLKLCAYLRLNLSSKEIAPLLNISVRSLEVKRYRLRKKLALNREESLVNYILGI